MAERCANCDELIGNLETPYVGGSSIVCEACYTRLQQRGRTTLAPEFPPPVVEDVAEFGEQDVVVETPDTRARCPNPNCRSADVQSLATAHSQGTSMSRGVAVGYVAGQIAGASASGTSTSMFAAAAAPPKKPNYGGPIAC